MLVNYPDFKVVTMPTRMDVNSSKEVETELAKVLAAGTTKVICDFSGCDYISSAGMRVLLQTLKQLEAKKGGMALSSLKPFVREVLDMAGFIPLFCICGTTDEAAAELA